MAGVDIQQSGTATVIKALSDGMAAHAAKVAEREEDKRKFNQQLQMMLMGAKMQEKSDVRKYGHLAKMFGMESEWKTGERVGGEEFEAGESEKDRQARSDLQERQQIFAAYESYLDKQQEITVEGVRQEGRLELQREGADIAEVAAESQFKRIQSLRDIDQEDRKEIYQLEYDKTFDVLKERYQQELELTGLKTESAEKIAEIRAGVDIALGDQRAATQLKLAELEQRTGKLDPEVKELWLTYRSTLDVAANILPILANFDDEEEIKKVLQPLLGMNEKFAQRLHDKTGESFAYFKLDMEEVPKKRLLWFDTTQKALRPGVGVTRQQDTDRMEAIRAEVKAFMEQQGYTELGESNKAAVKSKYNLTDEQLEEVLK